MDIRFFCYRCFVFLGLWVGYEAQNGNQTTHQRTDDVEEAEGELDKCRDTKNRTLRHTAGCPWNQYTRYGSAILCTSAQEFRSIASFGIFILIEQFILGDPLALNFTGAALLGIFVSFLVGIVLVAQGIMSIYLSHIHTQTQNRPLFVIDTTSSVNLDKDVR